MGYIQDIFEDMQERNCSKQEALVNLQIAASVILSEFIEKLESDKLEKDGPEGVGGVKSAFIEAILEGIDEFRQRQGAQI